MEKFARCACHGGWALAQNPGFSAVRRCRLQQNGQDRDLETRAVGPDLTIQYADFDADSDALGLAASFPHARARAQREARQRHEQGLRHFQAEIRPGDAVPEAPEARRHTRERWPSSVISARGTRHTAPELLFLTVGRRKPPASPAHFSTHRPSCPALISCAATLFGSLSHQALLSLAIPNA